MLRSRERRWIPSIVALVLFGLSASAAPVPDQAAAAADRHLVVTVLDKAGAPVANLTPRDFVLREDGAAREVLSVTPGATASHLVLLIDDSQAANRLVPFLRDGLKRFVTAIHQHAPATVIRLSTFGDRPTVRADFTNAAAVLTRSIDTLFPRPGAGAAFLEAIVETTRDLRTKRLDRAVVLAVVVDAGPEMSNESHTQVSDALKASGASLWTLAVHEGPAAEDASSEGRERAIVMGDVTRASGGQNKVSLGAQGIVAALDAMATTLTSQYDLTYRRPDRLIPPTRTSVETRDRAHTVLVRQWAAE